jgi:predicted phage tail protein
VPTNLQATPVSGSQINLSWTAPTNNGGSPITGYKIERSLDSTTWTTVSSNTGSTATTFTDIGLLPVTQYSYRVSAINSVGTGSPSNTAVATTLTAVPGVPTNLQATPVSGSQINLSWTAPTNNGGSPITGYMIERSTDGVNFGIAVPNTGTTALTFTDSGLLPLTTYYYRVHAINAIDTGSPSNIASATTLASLQGVKFDIANYIENLESQTTDKDTIHKLEEAKKKVQDSYRMSLWQGDGNHLNPKSGNKVFDSENDAVHHLMEIKPNRQSSSFNNSVNATIYSLVGVDKSLASIAINDASSSGGNPNEIAKAQQEMNKASDEFKKGHFDDAIDHYKHAWEHAQHAMH